MAGDAEMQPADSVDALSELADALEPKAEKTEAKRSASEAGEAEEEQEIEEESEDAESEEEEESEEESEEEAEADPTVKIKHDGKEVELKLSEALTLAQQGFDYSKKTMAVAEERKAAEAERAAVAEVRKKHDSALTETVTRLEAVARWLDAQIGDPPPVALAAQDAGHYLALKEAHEARKGKFHEAFRALQSAQAEQSRQRQDWAAEKAQRAEKVLKDTLPGWNETMFNELSAYAESLGLSPENAADAMLEPGLWQIVNKAKAYDAIQASKKEMKPKAQLTKVAKPTTQNVSGKAAARAKREAEFNKNPSVDTLANLFM